MFTCPKCHKEFNDDVFEHYCSGQDPTEMMPKKPKLVRQFKKNAETHADRDALASILKRQGIGTVLMWLGGWMQD